MNSVAFKKLRATLSLCFNYIHKKFLWGLLKNIDEKFLKFLFVGFLNTAFSYFIYALFITFGFVANLALFLQYLIGVLWNFKTTGTIVFQNKNNKLIFKFVASYIVTFLINSVLLKMLIKYVNEYLAQALLILPVAMLSFLILKYWVFKAKQEN
ncbi:MAG: GtrA family protein [Candidatus Gastranaerophilales bacterium]|nr:GtrA family protein [Candidatus Gastranaerophilales bacterium]